MRPKVLFVDDEPHVTEALKRALRKEDYVILTANSAHDALGILAREAVDVVISDERMPGMSGSDLLARVRQRYPDTMRIMLTGHASLEAAVRAINEGEVTRFLAKPCNEAELALAIEHALLKKERGVDLQSPASGGLATPPLFRELEQENPGITQVRKDEDGVIVLEDAGVDLAALAQTIDRALTSGKKA